MRPFCQTKCRYFEMSSWTSPLAYRKGRGGPTRALQRHKTSRWRQKPQKCAHWAGYWPRIGPVFRMPVPHTRYVTSVPADTQLASMARKAKRRFDRTTSLAKWSPCGPKCLSQNFRERPHPVTRIQYRGRSAKPAVYDTVLQALHDSSSESRTTSTLRWMPSPQLRTWYLLVETEACNHVRENTGCQLRAPG